jgi:hypothetical protein
MAVGFSQRNFEGMKDIYLLQGHVKTSIQSHCNPWTYGIR